MPDLNAECEREIERICANTGELHDHRSMLREAMRFAYADSARVCSDNADKATRDKAWAEGIASLDCRKAILARASEPGG